MNNKKLITTGIMAMAALVAIAEPVVTDVVAKQRYPWNGLVDITCRVSGIVGTVKTQYFELAAVMPDSGNVRYAQQFWIMRNGAKATGLTVQANGNYHLLWDAQADLGQVRYENMVVRATLTAHQRVQLWEGGPYWATTNIGAQNPEDNGYYFWWGDTIGYKRENNKWVASYGSSTNFSFHPSNTPTYGMSSDILKRKGWITADGVLSPEHDAAHVHWGGEWRMPKATEFSALISNCTTTWTTQNGVYGRLVTGKGAYANRSIFLPAAGYGSDANLNYAGSSGYYWSSPPCWDYSNYAWYFYLSSSDFYRSSRNARYYGHSVRPVRGFAK